MLFRKRRHVAAAGLCLAVMSSNLLAEEIMGVISVTATRSERDTKDVPEAIGVVDAERLEQTPMFNIKDALSEVPGVLITNNRGSYSARVVVRGAGLKANYGIREIMLIRDGVPITDPDSFTRLDFIDTQDIQQIEVTKGPGNLYAAGSAGGTIQVLSKSVFDLDMNTLKIAGGTEDTGNVHLRYATELSAEQAAALTFSHRRAGNNWRRHSRFDTTQLSLKHGLFFGENHVWENELSHTRANSDFPGSMGDAEFEHYLSTGEQVDNDTPFDHTGRDSEIWFFNSRMELDMGRYTLKPKFYFNQYSHYHPVTGAISVTPASRIFGADVEASRPHTLMGMEAELNTGITYRADINNDKKRYAYADVRTLDGSGDPFASRILATLSDSKGRLLEESDNMNQLYGFFVQESVRLNERLLLDVGTRVDRAEIEQDVNEFFAYDYGQGRYVAGVGEFEIDRDFLLFAPKIGLTYRLNPAVNAFVSVAQADQVPFANELDDNPDLDKATVRNVEVGLKGRARAWSFDTSVYYSRGEDEVVATRENGTSTFSNAGETKKIGFDVTGSYRINPLLAIGANYAYSDYTYEEFTEVVTGGGPPRNEDRSGNELPYVPRHKYNLFADYRHPSGFSARISMDSWGSYWMDNANTEKYGGYDFVTDLFLGYQRGPHRVSLNIDNVFDKRYATEAEKSTRGVRSYEPGAPRRLLLGYRYDFDAK